MQEVLGEMKIKPMNDRVLVLRVEEEQKTAGGIIIPEPPRKNRRRAR
jgi:chaperonin GroES